MTDTLNQEIVSGRLGALSTRLAKNAEEVRAAQRVRYTVFKQDMKDDRADQLDQTQLDADQFDETFDHLLVIDESNGHETIVGTQRFHVHEASQTPERFYSSMEFDVGRLLQKHPDKRFMELGRSCILEEYRSKRTMELLWHGTWDYALKNRADVMLGCASFAATDTQFIAEELSFLATVKPEPEWAVSSQRREAIHLKHFGGQATNPKLALRKLPPLIKGYLRLGASFSDCVVPDTEFGTIDILVVLPIAHINPKYVAYYGSNAERHRA